MFYVSTQNMYEIIERTFKFNTKEDAEAFCKKANEASAKDYLAIRYPSKKGRYSFELITRALGMLPDLSKKTCHVYYTILDQGAKSL